MNFILHRLLLIIWLVGLGLGLGHLKAGASSGTYNVETNLETTTTHKKLKTPKSIKKQPRQTIKDGDKFTRWSITIGSIFTLLAMVGLGIGLGLGILWLPFVSFGIMGIYLLYVLLLPRNKSLSKKIDQISIAIGALIAMGAFGLVAIALGIIFSTLWVWIAGISWLLFPLCVFLFIITIFSGLGKINY